MAKQHRQPNPLGEDEEPQEMPTSSFKRPRPDSDSSDSSSASTDSEFDEESDEGGEVSFDSDDVGDDGNDDIDDEASEEGEEAPSSSEGEGVITVDFGVFDMERHHVDATIHLMDQFCPDSYNEVDRDSFADALLDSPYTSIVKLNDGEQSSDDATEQEEEEVCGVCSVIHFYDCLQRYPAAFKALETLLVSKVWRTAAPGIAPIELLKSRKEGSSSPSSVKALLWISEYIQTVPIELTTQLLSDTLQRLENDSADEGSEASEAAKSFPCLFVVLSKIQRASSSNPTSKANGKERKGGDEAANFSIGDYVFWREEDEVLYGFRDQRVAVTVYRCRPQYEGQSEIDIPLTLAFAIQSESMHQAMNELKKQAVAPSSVTRMRA